MFKGDTKMTSLPGRDTGDEIVVEKVRRTRETGIEKARLGLE